MGGACFPSPAIRVCPSSSYIIHSFFHSCILFHFSSMNDTTNEMSILESTSVCKDPPHGLRPLLKQVFFFKILLITVHQCGQHLWHEMDSVYCMLIRLVFTNVTHFDSQTCPITYRDTVCICSMCHCTATLRLQRHLLNSSWRKCHPERSVNETSTLQCEQGIFITQWSLQILIFNQLATTSFFGVTFFFFFFCFSSIENYIDIHEGSH